MNLVGLVYLLSSLGQCCTPCFFSRWSPQCTVSKFSSAKFYFMYFQNFIQFDYITNPKITNPTCPIFKMIYYLKSQINPKNSKTNPKFQMNTKLPKTPQKFPNLKIPNESKNPKKSLDSGLLLAQQICVQYLNHYQYIT